MAFKTITNTVVPNQVEVILGFSTSRFNVMSEDSQGNLLLLNTYSGKFIKVNLINKQVAIEILEKPNEANTNSNLFKILYNKGFIVGETVNEFRRAELLHQDTLTMGGGLELTLLPNEDCNFRCKYCYESFEKKFMKESVQKGIVEFIKKNINKYSYLRINWFGGEPLTAISIIESLSKQLIAICAEHRIPYYSSMTTNGYNLRLDIFKRMQKCRVSQYQITLDGLSSTHDNQRVRVDGKGTFDVIVNNLKNIRDNINSKTFQIILRSNVTVPILDNILDFKNFLVKEFSSDARFSAFWQAAGNWGGDMVSDIEHIFCSSSDYIPSLIEASSEGVRFDVYRNLMRPSGSVCYASKKNHFVIGSDGIIYKCTVAFEEDFNQVGFISENGIMHIDRDKLSLWVTGHESEDKGCQKCSFRPACQGAACPLNRIKHNISPCPDVKTDAKKYMQVLSEGKDTFEIIKI